MENHRGAWRPLLLLVVCAAALRSYLAWSNPLITTDGPLFVWNAQEWVRQGWRQAVHFQKHPLYPLLIALFHGVAGGYDRAGMGISVVLGSLTLVPVYLLTRRLAGHGAGLFAAALLLVHPYAARLAGDVMTEATYYFWLMLAVWLGFVAGLDRRAWAAALSGGAAGLAYLTRFEGGLAAGVVGVWILLADVREWRTTWRGRLLRAAVLSVAFWAVAAPYILALHAVTGRWVLTKKGGAVEVETYSAPGAKAPKVPKTMQERVGEVLRSFAAKGANTFKFYFLPLLPAILLARHAPREWHAEHFLVGAWVTWLVSLLAADYLLGYSSHRYLLTLIHLALPWMGAGCVVLLAWSGRGGRRWAAIAAIAVFLAGNAVDAAWTRRDNQKGFRDAGEWIRGQGVAEDEVVLAVDEKVAYYAGGRFMAWRRMPFEAIEELIALRPIRYLAGTEKKILLQTPGFPIDGRGRIVRVWQSPPYEKIGPVVVYEVVPGR